MRELYINKCVRCDTLFETFINTITGDVEDYFCTKECYDKYSERYSIPQVRKCKILKIRNGINGK